MPRTFAVQRDIQAPPARVWALLTDAESIPAWNPVVASVDGRIADGETIAVKAEPNPDRAFKLRVSEVRPPERMVWSNAMPLGLFSGVRTFGVQARGEGHTAFSMQERYQGPLAPLIGRAIPDLQPSFERFADALKATAESPRPDAAP